MTEHGFFMACQHRRHHVAPPEHPRVSEGEGLPVQAMQAPGAKPAVDHPAVESTGNELPPPQDTVLPRRKLRKLSFPRLLGFIPPA